MSMQEVEIREALRQAIDEEMAKDKTVLLMGEEVAEYDGAYKISKGLLDKYGPDRIVDTPISENGFTGLAVGAAMAGLRPVVEYMSWNFSFVAFDQIISNAIKMHYMSGGRFKVPLVLRGPNGAAAQVSCQHSHCVEATYSNYPGLIVLAPSTAYDHKGLMKSAIQNNNPVIFLENELLYGIKEEIPKEEFYVPIGKANVAVEGSQLTIVSHSRMFHFCKQAVKELAAEGISCELIDLRTIKPFRSRDYCTVCKKNASFALCRRGALLCGNFSGNSISN
jgi:pyruvate dehydrogenase E1 component beta subunit